MVILFSAYALLRMQQRGIHPQEVVEAFTGAWEGEGLRAPSGHGVAVRELATASLRIRYRWDAGRVVVVNAMRTSLSPH